VSACRVLAVRTLPTLALLLALGACTHTVQVEAPKDPIVINLNVKIEQEVRVKVEKDVDDLLADNPELF
jgi:YnbE-like lipoprotein